jgi:hypothetical protein
MNTRFNKTKHRVTQNVPDALICICNLSVDISGMSVCIACRFRADFYEIGHDLFLRYNFVSGSTVVKALRYKSEGRSFDFRWCHWNFSLT